MRAALWKLARKPERSLRESALLVEVAGSCFRACRSVCGRLDSHPARTLGASALILLSGRVVQESGTHALEGQAYRADRAVTLLADDDLGTAIVRRIGVVDLVAVNEQDHVGVLLDSARFAQIAHHGTLVRALL